jgi:hypothetical protein
VGIDLAPGRDVALADGAVGRLGTAFRIDTRTTEL